jgi:hypothetical protein
VAHLRKITVRYAEVADKGIDPAGAIFLQVWLYVMTFIVTGAFSDKG